MCLTERDALEDIEIARAQKALINSERILRAAASTAGRRAPVYDENGDEVEPDEDDSNRVLTGPEASVLADRPIDTGDPLVDQWEREETSDEGAPLRFIDGPAPRADTADDSPQARLAAYSRPIR